MSLLKISYHQGRYDAAAAVGLHKLAAGIIPSGAAQAIEHSAPSAGRLKFISGTHTDHGLQPEHWDFLQQMAAEHQGGPMIKTFDLPEHVPDALNGLHGPSVGDAPVLDHETFPLKRGERPYDDRGVDRPLRPSRKLSVVAVPEFRPGQDPNGLVAFTAHGGPLAPQHPLDPNNRDVVAARKFWAEHALTGTRPAPAPTGVPPVPTGTP